LLLCGVDQFRRAADRQREFTSDCARPFACPNKLGNFIQMSRQRSWPAKLDRSFGFGGSDSSFDTLSDNLALELSHGRKHVELKPANGTIA
jgi:hypothetical protein